MNANEIMPACFYKKKSNNSCWLVYKINKEKRTAMCIDMDTATADEIAFKDFLYRCDLSGNKI